MNRSRVFVVSEPLKWDQDRNQWVRSFNLTPATQYGELIFLMPPNNEGPSDPAVIVDTLEKKLKDFTSHDYLLPTGNPVYIALAAAIAADNAGTLNLLQWQASERCYAIVRAKLWPEPA